MHNYNSDLRTDVVSYTTSVHKSEYYSYAFKHI